MSQAPYLDQLIENCKQAAPRGGDERFIGWETIVTVLVLAGLKAILPELKEWVKRGASAIAMKRQELRKRLRDYALEKELDFPAAEQAAEVIAQNVNEDNLEKIVQDLER